MKTTSFIPGFRTSSLTALMAAMMFHAGCLEAPYVQEDGDGDSGTTTETDGGNSGTTTETEDGNSGTTTETDGGDSGTTTNTGSGTTTETETGTNGGHPEVCGSSIQALTAGQTIDIGSTVISNDGQSLYVRIETTSGWKLSATHVHVGQSLSDVPMAANGAPIPGQLDDSHALGADGATHDTFMIPFSTLDFAAECGSTLYVWAHAEAFLPAASGEAQQETAWGGDTEGTGSRRWFFVAPYSVACCEDDEG